MKTTNVYGEDNLSGDHNIICPYCGKRVRPQVFTHTNIIENRPIHYQRMCGYDGSYGAFMICPSCSEMFFAYSQQCLDKVPMVYYDTPSICGNANMFIKANLTSTDYMTEIENMFAHKKMDITVYRPYRYKAGYIGEQTAIQLLNDNEQVICTVYNIDTDKFIKDNVKVLQPQCWYQPTT